MHGTDVLNDVIRKIEINVATIIVAIVVNLVCVG